MVSSSHSIGFWPTIERFLLNCAIFERRSRMVSCSKLAIRIISLKVNSELWSISSRESPENSFKQASFTHLLYLKQYLNNFLFFYHSFLCLVSLCEVTVSAARSASAAANRKFGLLSRKILKILLKNWFARRKKCDCVNNAKSFAKITAASRLCSFLWGSSNHSKHWLSAYSINSIAYDFDV